ncbi:hypothetical protein [uncultured Sulfitobacter sp.]|nr:hypothetical protein [uncultured Sulfitobacter sp.]
MKFTSTARVSRGQIGVVLAERGPLHLHLARMRGHIVAWIY